MKRRRLFTLLAIAGGWPSSPNAQESRRYRIGVLDTVSASQNTANLNGLRRGLQKYGYVEGRNLSIEYRSADGRPDLFPQLARDLVNMGVDLIVTRGTPAARAAKAATSTTPIVMAAIGEPLGVGVIEGLARPGGNITGLSAFVTELAGKRVQLMKEAFPSIATVGFMLNMGNPVSPPQWAATQAAARLSGLSTELFDVRSAQNIIDSFSVMSARKVDALSVGIDTVTQTDAALIVELCAKHRLPAAYPSREFVDVGGLMSYGPSYSDLYFRAAIFIDKIFKGARPGDLPVEQPIKLELLINMKTVKGSDLVIPASVLTRTDELVE